MAKDNASMDLLSSSLENDELIQKIQETNAPGLDEDDVKPLLQIIVDIMTQASPLSAKINLEDISHGEKSDDKVVEHIADVLESPINYTSYVMTWNCVGVVDSHAVTMQILESLSNYWWGAKALIAYAAFAINYGEFSLLTQSPDKTIATLMGFSDQSSIQSDHSNDVLQLLATTLKLTCCMVNFRGIPPEYSALQRHAIPLAIYVIIRTLVVCTSFLTKVLSNHAITKEEIKMLPTLQKSISLKLRKFHMEVDVSTNIDTKPILAIVEDILHLARTTAHDEHALALPPAATTAGSTVHHPAAHVPAHHESSHDKTSYINSDIVKLLAYPINKISIEIIYKCASGGESHQVTMDLLKSLSSFTWDVKVVIAFAGFAIYYGEFWLVEHHHTKTPLAKNIAILKDLPEIMANSQELRKQLDAVLDLLTAILKVTHCIIEFKEIPTMYISAQYPETTAVMAHIQTAIYWCIRGLIVCASTLRSLGGGLEYSTSVSWEILSLAHKLSVILEQLQEKMRICKDIIERNMAEDLYAQFKMLVESAHIDNMKVLSAFFRHREDQRPLFHGSRSTNERLDVLRLKYVLLLISDLDLPPEELHVLYLIHKEHAMRHDYEILWLPISDPYTSVNEVNHAMFLNLRNNMPWYSAEHPNAIEPVAIRYIREELRFTHMPMLVVLDPYGKLSYHDALPMMWIWGANAFPFTREWERKLWEETEWNIDLIADAIDPRIPEWIKNNRVICLYGGDNINWVRKFTKSAKAAACALNVQLEMLYVGKHNPKEKVRLCHEIIAQESLSHIFATDYYNFVWHFWARLASMFNSKQQMGRTVEDDHIMQGIHDLLTYDSSEQGWAIFSSGTYEITMASGNKLVSILDNYIKWGYKVDHPDKFVPVLDKHVKGYHPENQIPKRMGCTESGKTKCYVPLLHRFKVWIGC